MTIWDVFVLQWRRRSRNGSLIQEGLRSVAFALVGAFLGFISLWFGLSFPHLVAQLLPERPPLPVLNDHMLSFIAALLGLRFVFQGMCEVDIRSLLTLPVSDSQLVRLIQLGSVPSILNLLSIMGTAGLLLSTVRVETAPFGAFCWGAGTIIAIGLTQLLNQLLRIAWKQNYWSVLMGSGVFIILIIVCDITGLYFVRIISGKIFGGFVRSPGLSLIASVVIAIGLFRMTSWAIRQHRYALLEFSSAKQRDSGAREAWLPRRGSNLTTSLIFLELKLFSRNRRPQEIFWGGVSVLALWLGIAIFGGSDNPFLRLVVGFMITGFMPIMYGQFSISWHGNHFDSILSKIDTHTIVKSQLIFLILTSLLPTLILTPIIIYLSTNLFATLLSLFLYNCGIGCPLILAANIWWNRRDAHPTVSHFSATSGSLRPIIFIFILTVGPIALLDGAGNFPMLLIVSAVGLIGLTVMSTWTQNLSRLLQHRRHVLAREYRWS